MLGWPEKIWPWPAFTVLLKTLLRGHPDPTVRLPDPLAREPAARAAFHGRKISRRHAVVDEGLEGAARRRKVAPRAHAGGQHRRAAGEVAYAVHDAAGPAGLRVRVPWRMEADALGSDVVRFSADVKILALMGILVDKVEGAHPAPLRGDEAAWKSECEVWRTIALERMKAYATQEESFGVFCKTLCLGDYRDRDGVLRTICGDAYNLWISGQDHSCSDGPRDDFSFRVKAVGMERSWVFTEKGYLAIAPGDTKEGGLICFFKGNLDPSVLRESGDGFAFIGDTFVPGLMNGEGIQEAKGSDVKEFWIQ